MIHSLGSGRPLVGRARAAGVHISELGPWALGPVCRRRRRDSLATLGETWVRAGGQVVRHHLSQPQEMEVGRLHVVLPAPLYRPCSGAATFKLGGRGQVRPPRSLGENPMSPRVCGRIK